MGKTGFCFAVLVLAHAAVAQDTNVRMVTGLIRDSARTPVWLAVVETGNGHKVASDDSGRFTLRVPAKNEVRLEIRRIGWHPEVIRLPPGADTALEVVLRPIARVLPATEVRAVATLRTLENRGFYRRLADKERGLINGEFITPEDIERRRPPRISWILDGVQGVRVRKAKSPGVLKWDVLGSGGCTMTLYLDGIRLNRLGDPNNVMTDHLDELVQPGSVAGLEVYGRAGRVPPEFQSLIGSCGAVLIWTR